MLPFTPRDGERQRIGQVKNQEMTDEKKHKNPKKVDEKESNQSEVVALSEAVTIADIEKLSSLSRIKISEDEKKTFAIQIGSILKYVNQIKEVVADSKRAMKPSDYPHRNIMREDDDNRELVQDPKTMLESAPESQDGFIKVKKILN